MRTGQMITQMEGDETSLPRRITVYTSDMRQVGLQYDRPWETVVINSAENRGCPEFGDYILHAEGLEGRALHHYHVVGEMRKHGYMPISHQDDFEERRKDEECEALCADLNALSIVFAKLNGIKIWNERLAEIPNLAFTSEELEKIRFLKYLRDCGMI